MQQFGFGCSRNSVPQISETVREKEREKDGAFRSILAYRLIVDFGFVRVDTGRGVTARLLRGSDTKERKHEGKETRRKGKEGYC